MNLLSNSTSSFNYGTQKINDDGDEFIDEISEDVENNWLNKTLK